MGSERLSAGQAQGPRQTPRTAIRVSRLGLYRGGELCGAAQAPEVKRFYQRKRARTHAMVAIKAVAHKLARACYYVLRDQVPFVMAKAFA